MSSPYEQIVVDSLNRIEEKCDRFHVQLTEHTENDRIQFSALDSAVDLLTMDHVARKTAAHEAGHAAGSRVGKVWAIVAMLLSAVATAVVQAYTGGHGS